jgi:hypothetical protein
MKRDWTSDEIAQLRQLAKDGKFAKPIAAALHRAETTVRRKAHELGIDIRRSAIRKRSPDVPTHAERTAIMAVHRRRPLPFGVGQATLEDLLRKRWIELNRGAWQATQAGLDAILRKIPLQD